LAGIKRCSISDGIDGAGELGVALDGSGFNLHDALFNFALRPELSVKLSADVQAGGRGAEFRFLLQLAGLRPLRMRCRKGSTLAKKKAKQPDSTGPRTNWKEIFRRLDEVPLPPDFMADRDLGESEVREPTFKPQSGQNP